MLEQQIRPIYQTLLVNPLLPILKGRVTPNQLTLVSGLFGLLVWPALLLNQSYLAIALLVLSGYCDTLDGSLARCTHNLSPWGSVLDIMTDRVVEVVVVMAIWSLDKDARAFGCLLMMACMLLCITSFLVVGIFQQNHGEKGFHYSPGLMERAEAFAFFIAIILWPNYFHFLALSFCALVLWTALYRLYEFRKQSIV